MDRTADSLFIEQHIDASMSKPHTFSRTIGEELEKCGKRPNFNRF